MKILIAEDDQVLSKLLQLTLERWNHEVTIVTDGKAALARLISDGAPPLAILDVIMPGVDGFEVCRRVRAAASETVAPYIILLTAKSNREEIVEGLTAGADDYLIKPYNQNELLARVNSGVRVIELQIALAERVRELEKVNSKLRQAETELRDLSLTDDLTGLRNRRGFFEFAGQAQAVAKRANQPMLLFYLDMDNLKIINDRFGHDAGSRSLVGVARALRRSFRASDVIARIGGDEFAVLATNAAGEQAQIRIEKRLQTVLREETERGKHPRELSLSVGVVEVKPGGGSSLDEQLRAADKLMYQQKREKKNDGAVS